MLILVEIDLSQANLALFDNYEVRVLGLLARHGARLEERLRSVDGLRECHLLHFPDNAALAAFRADPDRMALQESWLACGAQSSLNEVLRVESR